MYMWVRNLSAQPCMSPIWIISSFKITSKINTPYFTENSPAEAEIKKLPDTIDRDEFEYSEHHGPICYFIIGGNEQNIFHLNPIDHTLVVSIFSKDLCNGT